MSYCRLRVGFAKMCMKLLLAEGNTHTHTHVYIRVIWVGGLDKVKADAHNCFSLFNFCHNNNPSSAAQQRQQPHTVCLPPASYMCLAQRSEPRGGRCTWKKVYPAIFYW